MLKCPICGKALKNPNSPNHIKSKFHQDALRNIEKQKEESPIAEEIEVKIEKIESQTVVQKKSNLKEQKEESRDAKLKQLQENLLDEQKFLNISELEFLKGYEGEIVDSLVDLLKTQDYHIEFEDLEAFFHIIDVILSFLSYDDISIILVRFEQGVLKDELKDKIFYMDFEILFATPYGFDLTVHLISHYLHQEDLLEFLANLGDLEELLEKSYYEVNDANNNPTTIIIEKTLDAGLKNDDQEVYNNVITIINNSGTFFEHLKKTLLNTFRINKFITLKLVGNRTNIYVKNQLFNQCKYLLLNIQTDRIREYDEIGSIDEAVELLDRRMEGRGSLTMGITPETEFWGHCSNIQAWVENDYDTRILHRNLAFPLLRKLTEVGDPKAKIVYKDEIVSRFQSSYAPVIEFIFNGNYLKALSKAEINDLVEVIDFDKFISQRFNRKQDLLLRFANLGCIKAKKLLSLEMKSQLQTAKLTEMRSLLARTYHTKLTKDDILTLYQRFLIKRKQPGNEELKVHILGDFVRLKVLDAKPFLKEQMLIVLAEQKKITPQYSQYRYSHHYQNPALIHLKVFNKQELEELFDTFLSSITPEQYSESVLSVLSKFSDLGISKAKKTLKIGLVNITKRGDISTLLRVATIQLLKTLTKQDLEGLFDTFLSNITPEQYSESVLTVISKFSDLGISKAKNTLKTGLINTIKKGDITTLRRVATVQRLKTLTKQDIISICTEIDFNKKFSQNPQVTLNLLQRFKKFGYENAEKIIRDSIIGVLKTPTEMNVRLALNKNFLKKIENDDLKAVLEAKDSKTVENLLTILQTTNKSNLRTKIVNFFTLVKEFSGPILSQKVKDCLIETDAESFHKLLKAKVLTLLLKKDKDFLYNHPKCKLRDFLVSYEGNEYVVDARLNLNLSNLGLKDITKIKGLNSLTHLEALDLRDNHLTAIIGIGNLTKLRKLRLQGNNISPQFIKHLGGLDRYGNAKYPEKFVRYSKSLEEGGITYVSIGSRNLEVFGDELILSRFNLKKIKEIIGLSKIKNLYRLDLSHNQLKDLKGIEKLTDLKVLNLSHNQLESTKGLEKLVNLEELRLYGNGITDFPEREHLPHIQILDLDTRRKVSTLQYLKYLFQSLKMEDLKQVCREHGIRGYSGMKRDRLIYFTLNSLAEEEQRMVISKLEMRIIGEGIEMAIRKIEHKEREHVELIRITNSEFNEVEFKFKGFNWETKSYVSITPKTINNPERDCDCRIGSNMGLCSHFWIGVIYSLKAGFFKLSDWTLTPLPPNLEKRLSHFKIITDSSNNKRLINEKDNSASLIQHINSRIHIQNAKLNVFERRQYTWDNRIITYYLNTLKNIKIAPAKAKNETAPLDSLLVRFSENMFTKYKLDKKKHVSLTGEVTIDSYLGFMLKNVFIVGSPPTKSTPKEKQIKINETESAEINEKQGIEGNISINFNKIKDDLSGSWWHHISTENFLFIQKIPIIENYKVNKDDILIHKQIRPGDRFPSVRYHLVQENGTKQVKNAEIKDYLVNKLCQHVQEHECLPPSAHYAKEFKNGNIQINYAPSSHVKFSLTIRPANMGVDRIYFQRKSRTIDAKIKTEEPRFGAPSEKQWQIGSESDPNKTYTVTKQAGGKWSCTCPHHVFRRATCKHILEAMRR